MKSLLLALLLVLLIPATSWAFRLSPMIVNFAPSGSGATQTFVLENTGSDKVAVEIETYHRLVDEEGHETRTPTDEFSVYPQQVALGPNEKRNVRVTWTGTRTPDRELNYRLVVTELPVNLKKPQEREHKPGANITFLMQYVASLYVTPDGARPKITVDSFKVLPDGKGDFVLKNAGLAHRVLKGIQIFLAPPGTSKDKRTELKGDAVEQLEGENVLGLSSRHVILPLPSSVVRTERAHPGSLKAEVEFH